MVLKETKKNGYTVYETENGSFKSIQMVAGIPQSPRDSRILYTVSSHPVCKGTFKNEAAVVTFLGGYAKGCRYA